MAEDKKTPRPRRTTSKGERQTINIELTRFKSLLEALDDPMKVFRIIVTISAIGVLLFAGITLVVISIKQIYPYNEITTNAFGATTFKNEKSEVSYWLLNTAELWANSGIKVKKGQVIKITASGKKHTAVHHLVDDTKENKPELNDPWVGTDGTPAKPRHPGRDERYVRDSLRAKYRIFPDKNQDALLVQVVPFNGSRQDRPVSKYYPPKLGTKPNQFTMVGKEKEIYIEEDGVLHFAINDIVLDDRTVIRMMSEIANSPRYVKCKTEKELNDYLDSLETNVQINKENFKKTDVYNSFLKNFNSDTSFVKNNILGLGKNKDKDWIELFGYCMNNYKEPWFEDNIGSFLILVETVTD